MSVKYLLPCRCGQQIIVEPREAGETTVCPCGQPLPIPTMLEMTSLEPVPAETSLPLKHAWGWQHRMLLLGATLVLASVGLAVLGQCFRRPPAPIDAIDPVAFRESAANLTPLQTWHYWGLMKQGLDRRTDQRYADQLTMHHVKQMCVGALFLAGIALIGAGVAMGKKTGRRGEGERGRQHTP